MHLSDLDMRPINANNKAVKISMILRPLHTLHVWLGISAVLMLLLSGCASVSENNAPKALDAASIQPKPPTAEPKTALVPITDLPAEAKKRSRARWDMVLGGKFAESFDFLTVASRRGITAADYGQQISKLRFRAADVISATCESDNCTVVVNVRMGQVVSRVGEVPHEFPIQERWVLVDGTLGLIRR
jgi:uncharacterized protein YceK